jgi:DNA-binding protein
MSSMGLKSKQEILASIPQVEVLLKTKPIQDLILEHSQQVVTDAVRLVLAKTRRQILSQAVDWFPEDTIQRDLLIQMIIQQTQASM